MLALRSILGSLLVCGAFAPVAAAAPVTAPDEGGKGSSAPLQASGGRASPAPDDPTSPLRSGASGARVKEVQRALGLKADGAFGARTTKAVRTFQRRSGLPATGEVDALTALSLSLRSPKLVRTLQRTLKVKADGRLGAATKRAVRRAEKRVGIPVDGEVDPMLLSKLGIALPAPVVTVASAAVGPKPVAADAQAWVGAARARLGAPYRTAGSGPDAFDCSGLVWWAMRSAGRTVPRSSFQQYTVGTAVTREQVQAGDLVFFDTAGPGPSDVGIATGPTTVISATTHGVMEHAIFAGYWAEHYVGARRL